jgi:DMSO reductase family type II enzyme heme b subunit
MRAHYVPPAQLEVLLDPDATAWKSAGREELKLEGTPLGMQLTAHIRAAWAGRKIGSVEQVSVAAVHDGQVLAFRLEWSAAGGGVEPSDNHEFTDGAAVVLPSSPGAPIITMGAPGVAVNAWYWRADSEGARHVVAEGLGSSRTLDVELVRGRGAWKDGRWRVVIARALRVDTSEPIAQLEPGAETGFGVAVWDGNQGERAGIKAFSGPLWLELQLDAVPETTR